MKKYVKRYLTALLAVSLVFVGGCSDGGKTAKTDEVPTLLWYIMGNSQPDMNLVMDKINETLPEKIGAKLDLQIIDSAAYSEKMNMLMASSSEFDICFVGYNNKYSNAADKGGLLPLKKYIDVDKEFKDSIPEYAWRCAYMNGDYYAVPNLQIMAKATGIQTSQVYVDKYGITQDKIKKLEDLEPYLEMVKQDEPDKFPFNESWGIDSFSPLKDYEIVDDVALKQQEDGTWKAYYKYYVPEYKEAVWKMNEWYKKGYIRKDALTVLDTTADVSAGRYVFGCATFKPGLDEMKKAAGSDVRSFLAGNVIINNSSGCAAMTGISRSSKHPDEAFKLISAMNLDKELYNTICFGLEGVHYNMLDNGKIEYAKPKGENGYYLRSDWVFGNQFNAYLFKDQKDDVWEQTDRFNAEAKLSEFIGFYPDTKPIRTELAQLETIKGTYSFIDKGVKDPDTYYDEFLSELKAAGIDKVCEEYERQANEFYKNRSKNL